MKSNKPVRINIIASLALQVVTILSGFIIPRLLLKYFGSETNGLISSLTQFLNYIMLIEGGITSVLMANLYKPLREKDMNRASAILSAANSFYKKMGLILIGYSVLLSVIYPLVVRTSFSFEFVCSLTLILTLNLCIQYFFALSLKTFLRADKKVAFISLIQIISIILNTVLTACLIIIWPNVHIVKLIASLAYIIQPICFSRYIKKHYKLDYKAKPDNKALKQRWSAFGINIAAFIHNNTDIFIITIFLTLTDVSIYAVYALVTSGLKRIIQAISEGIVPSLGHAYASDDSNKLKSVFKKYESIIFFSSFFLFTVGGLLITPFVQVFTDGVNDANYYQPLFGWLLILGELIFCIREPYVNMAYSANKFKAIAKHAYIESAINIVASIILVQSLGLVGVAIGTFAAMLYRTGFQIIFLKKHVLFLSIKNVAAKLLPLVTVCTADVILCMNIFNVGSGNYTIARWIQHAITCSLLVAITLAPLFILYSRKEKAK